MGLRKALLTATMACALPLAAATTTAPAQAQPITGLYIAGGAGVNLLQSTDVTGRGLGGGQLGEIDWQAGVAGVLSLGWGFGNGLRAEIEGNYRWNHIDKAGIDRSVAAPFPGALTQFRGSQRTYGVMANVLYDFALFGAAPITPYVGLGAGWAWVETNKLRATSPALGLRFESDDTDSRFAYQAIAGLAFNLPAPGLAVTAEYRFFGTLSPEHQGRVRSILLPGAPVVAAGTVETDNFNHSIMVGLRYAFAAPRRPAPPPPAVAPAPTQPSTYLVFFDWDRADLTARAREIIGQAANAARTQQTTRIEVAGHADRSGTPQYNQRLSQRRADNVAAELVRQGVPRQNIFVTAFGETRPLVPTADGVREPQNRRVEIVLR